MNEIEDFESSTTAAWTHFQARLADHLHEMEEDDLLLLEAESALGDEDGAAPYVQFCAWEADRLRAEAVSNAYLAETHLLDDASVAAVVELGFEAPTYAAGEEPDGGSANFWVNLDRDDADRLAVMSVRALRDVYGVAHPAFVHGLEPEEDGGGDEDGMEQSASGVGATDDEPAVYPSDGPEHLQRLVDAARRTSPAAVVVVRLATLLGRVLHHLVGRGEVLQRGAMARVPDRARPQPGAYAEASGLPCFEGFTFDHRADGVIGACRRDNKELSLIRVDDNRVAEEIVRPADARYLDLPPLAYEEEIDRWEQRRKDRRSRRPGSA